MNPSLEMFARMVVEDTLSIFEACDTKEDFVNLLTGKRKNTLFSPEELAGKIWDNICQQYLVGHSLGRNGCENCKKARAGYDEFLAKYRLLDNSNEFEDCHESYWQVYEKNNPPFGKYVILKRNNGGYLLATPDIPHYWIVDGTNMGWRSLDGNITHFLTFKEYNK